MGRSLVAETHRRDHLLVVKLACQGDDIDDLFDAASDDGPFDEVAVDDESAADDQAVKSQSGG